MTISQPRALLLGLTLVLAACGGEGLTLPPDGASANIEVMSGNGQSGRVGSPLADSLVVQVTDTRGRPVAGANVVFEFTADGSAASPASAASDANGRAASRLVLGTRVGLVNGTVRVPVAAGITPVEATITATALSDNADSLALVSGNGQSGAVGTTLLDPLVVAVADQFGNPIPNVTIEWTVTNGGSVSASTTITGADGQTSVTRTLGPTAGEQTTIAAATGLVGSPVTFTHTATAGSASRIEIVSGNNQSALVGSELSDPLVVRVLDEANNPIQGRAVTWVPGTGNGTAAPENTVTDAQGQASTRWTLGQVGVNTMNAVASGVQTATVTFSATATAGSPSAANSSVSVSDDKIPAGTGSSTITVTVRDAANNPVSGVSVAISSTGSGNTISPASASTGSNGVATFTFSSTVAEEKTITATAGGVPIDDRATITVQKVGSTIEITSDDPDPSTVGQNVTVEFTVEGSGGTPSGDVVITINGGLPSETCTATLSSGSGSCVLPVTLPGDRRVIKATYAGDARFSGDTDTENHRVNPLPIASTTTTITNDAPDPSDAGTAITVSFTVTSSSGTPTGTVTIFSFQESAPAASCTASVSQGSCNITLTVPGTQQIGATYSGDNQFEESSTSVDHVVSPVAPVNQAPLAADDAYSTPGGGAPLTVLPADGVLKNDTDTDGPQPLTAQKTSDPTQGTLTFNPDGSFTYAPSVTAVGTDAFTYQASDGEKTSSATVNITINP